MSIAKKRCPNCGEEDCAQSDPTRRCGYRPELSADAVRRLEAIRDELTDRFNRWDAEFTPWTLELLSIVETALAEHSDGEEGV